MFRLPKKVAIVGAGPSGLFMAKQLRLLAQKKSTSIEIILLEKENWVGGKCHTYSDPMQPLLKTEMGAGAVAPNYGLVIDAMKEFNVSFEYMIPTNKDGLELDELFNRTSFTSKPRFMWKFLSELKGFDDDYKIYRQAVQNKFDLPELLKGSFQDYCQARDFQLVPLLQKPFVPGFGYGALCDCPTYSVMEYMGHTTMLDLVASQLILRHPPLLSVHHGYQFLMEQIAATFNVQLGVHFKAIQREGNNVTISYECNSQKYDDEFDCLILANSPLNWPALPMQLTEIESECVKNLQYYRYPVAVCRIKGLTKEQYFFPNALEKDGFGHVALITTRDNREEPAEGRLCTIYVNLPAGKNNYSIRDNWDSIRSDLLEVKGITEVTLVEEKIWEDYMSTLPWALRLKLNHEEKQNPTTLHVGSFMLGGFEDVISVANGVTNLANELYDENAQPIESFSKSQAKSAYHFFKEPTYAPIQNDDFTNPKSSFCTLI